MRVRRTVNTHPTRQRGVRWFLLLNFPFPAGSLPKWVMAISFSFMAKYLELMTTEGKMKVYWKKDKGILNCQRIDIESTKEDVHIYKYF